MNQAHTKCPECEAKYSYISIENTSNMEMWSDGFCMPPIRKDFLTFAKCPACSAFFWLKKNVIEELADSTTVKNLENSFLLDNISKKEIDLVKDAIKDLANSAKKEIHLRLLLWHVINHIIRKYDSQGLLNKIKHKLFESADYKNSLKLYDYNVSLKLSNLIRLTNLLKLDKKENTNYLLFAEIYREIGDFGKAMVFCHKAETSSKIDSERITLLKKNISSKNKIAYKL